jgi:hypothetical protein
MGAGVKRAEISSSAAGAIARHFGDARGRRRVREGDSAAKSALAAVARLCRHRPFVQGFGLGGVIADFGLVFDLVGFGLFVIFVLATSIVLLGVRQHSVGLRVSPERMACHRPENAGSRRRTTTAATGTGSG